MSKFDAFISYSHQDCGSIAPAIQSGIQTIGRPWYQLKRNLNIFRDETNLSVTPELWSRITDALDNSKTFILFASPIAATSKWVSDEIVYWINKKDESGESQGLKNIFIVQAQGDIEWDAGKNDFDWLKTNCLPREVVSGKFLKIPYWIDLRPYVKERERGKSIDHKAAGFTTAMTKIIGGITGEDPWKIESAELRAQSNSKRIRGLIAVTLFILSLVIFNLYRESNKQKKIAFDNEKRAVANEKRAVANEQKAINNLKQFRVEEFNRNLRNGKVYMEAEEYGFAKKALENARITSVDPLCDTIPEIMKERSLILSLIETCNKKIK
jgi:MTH538 TIR-like domain (DUF1863)